MPLGLTDSILSNNIVTSTASISTTLNLAPAGYGLRAGAFARWKEHDSYQRAFDGSLLDLKAEA